MGRSNAIMIIGALLALSSACVTRNLHGTSVADWEKRHGALAMENEQQRAESEQRNKEKDAKIQDLETELTVYKEGAENRQAQLQDTLDKRKAEIEALRKQQAVIEANLRQYQGLRDAFGKMIGSGELDVYRRHGRIMVALPSSVLFSSGRADLSVAGKTALAKVAGVLGQLEGRRFLIAGHTDNVPISTSRFPDNWALSTERATVVTRFLIDNGMKPTNVAAAGYGEHDPIRDNTTADNRARNRRIEIILMPNIEEMPELPE
jgi:chemotaxis protein MotB